MIDASTAVVGLGSATVAGIGVFLGQRNRYKDKYDLAVLQSSTANASNVSEALQQWRFVTERQNQEIDRQAGEIEKLRVRAEDCEAKGRIQEEQLQLLHSEVTKLKAK